MFDLESYLLNLNGVTLFTEHVSIECPWCGVSPRHKTHFFVHREIGYYHCFRCHAKGNLVKLVSKLENISYYQARRMVEDRLDFKVRQKPKGEELEPLQLPKRADLKKEAKAYLDKRGIKEDAIKAFGLYYCNTGRYADRIIIPIRRNSIPFAFQARSIKNADPKYLSPSYPLNQFVFNIDRIFTDNVVLVEGPLDVIHLWQMNIPTVSCFGKSLSESQIHQLLQREVRDVTILYDPDAFDDSLKRWKELYRYFPIVKIGLLEDGDPADSSEFIIRRALAYAIDTPLKARKEKRNVKRSEKESQERCSKEDY